MKQLLLVRHAKSSWAQPHLADVDRPLNKRGKQDGEFMPDWLRKKGIIPDYILSSHAVRAYSTAKYFAKAFKDELQGFDKCRDLYFGSIEDWLYEINAIPETVHLPAFFSHNPNITYMANMFGADDIDNIPTCGIVHLRSTVDRWEDLHFDNSEICGLYFPKLVRL